MNVGVNQIAADRDAVERLRQTLAKMDPGRKALQATGHTGDMLLTCDTGHGDPAEIAILLPSASDAECDFFLYGVEDAMAALRIIDRADDYFRSQRKAPAPVDRPKQHGSECAMLCGKETFGRFMDERHGPCDPTDADSVAGVVKTHLKIKSRSVLNSDPEAVKRWKDLRAEYHAWMDGKL